MMNLLNPVSFVISTALTAETATLAASNGVINESRAGRHGITITATAANTYIGGSDVTSENGTPLANGTSITLPMEPGNDGQIYFIGSIKLLEYF